MEPKADFAALHLFYLFMPFLTMFPSCHYSCHYYSIHIWCKDVILKSICFKTFFFFWSFVDHPILSVISIFMAIDNV